jgi:hypothetical protein
MKTKFYMLIMLILPLLVNCSNEENKNEYNFSVLGIEKINIDEIVINTESNGFPVKNSETFIITGSTYVNETHEYELIIIGKYSENQNIVVNKKYNDVSILIESNIESKNKTITISRAGYLEKIIYHIAFSN